MIIVNKEKTLPPDYIPLDLEYINVEVDRVDEKKFMRHKAAVSLRKMFTDARKEGVKLVGVSAYRSYARQKEIYDESIKQKGEEYTAMYIAYPGTSEHQTGLAIDISCKDIEYELEERYAYTKEGRWVAANCYKYGYIIRYPKKAEHITGYRYEPWHIRYIGVVNAKKMKKYGVSTLEEYVEKCKVMTYNKYSYKRR